jgi:hypothetical protein
VHEWLSGWIDLCPVVDHTSGEMNNLDPYNATFNPDYSKQAIFVHLWISTASLQYHGLGVPHCEFNGIKLGFHGLQRRWVDPTLILKFYPLSVP